MLPQYFKFKSKYRDVDNKAYTKLINQNSKKFQVLTILLELGILNYTAIKKKFGYLVI